MNKYKISFIFNNENDINNILIKVLNKELKEYIPMICKNNKRDITSSSINPSIKEGKNC